MPLRIDYAARYFRRLEDVRERIAEDNPAAAVRLVERIRTAVERLRDFPSLGRPGRVSGTRELVIPGTSYIVPYRIAGDQIQILALVHCAQPLARPISSVKLRVRCASFETHPPVAPQDDVSFWRH
jgi:toxin ParE1/3/4